MVFARDLISFFTLFLFSSSLCSYTLNSFDDPIPLNTPGMQNFCNFPRLLREESNLHFQPYLVIEFLPKFHNLSNNSYFLKCWLDGVFFHSVYAFGLMVSISLLCSFYLIQVARFQETIRAIHFCVRPCKIRLLILLIMNALLLKD